MATGRDTDRLADLAEPGVQVRQADFADSAGLHEAFKGARKVLLVSTTTVVERFDNHTRAIDAAKRAGAQRIASTSTLNAHSANMILADAHSKTERYLRDSGVPWVVLRNGWYLDNYTSRVPLYLQTGAVAGSAGTGRVSAASRRDYAEAAATVLTSEGHAGSVYERGGDTAFTLAELAAALSTASGQGVVCHDLPVEQYRSALLGAGLPAETAVAATEGASDRTRPRRHRPRRHRPAPAAVAGAAPLLRPSRGDGRARARGAAWWSRGRALRLRRSRRSGRSGRSARCGDTRHDDDLIGLLGRTRSDAARQG
ncbi:NAD(P)H-binding protein [Streptomyces antimycoticus]|nr:NAD(P)H-binding protein [Streptomyces antimycoticus]